MSGSGVGVTAQLYTGVRYLATKKESPDFSKSGDSEMSSRALVGLGQKIIHFTPRFLERSEEDLVFAFESLDRSFGARRATHQRFVAIGIAIEAIALANHHQGERQTFGMVFGKFRDAFREVAPFVFADVGERGYARVGK